MRRLLLSIVGICALAAPASAVPIVYSGNLQNGVAVAGVNTQSAGSSSNPIGANYYSFFANAGDNVTVFGDRQAGHYDMSFWVFRGTYTDTNQFGPSFPGLQAGNLIGFGDDQDPPNLPGPFGDPRINFIAPTTGLYTVAVTNFLSSSGPPNPFTLQVNGNTPEPASLAVFGLGMLVMGGYGARRVRKS